MSGVPCSINFDRLALTFCILMGLALPCSAGTPNLLLSYDFNDSAAGVGPTPGLLDLSPDDGTSGSVDMSNLLGANGTGTTNTWGANGGGAGLGAVGDNEANFGRCLRIIGNG